MLYVYVHAHEHSYLLLLSPEALPFSWSILLAEASYWAVTVAFWIFHFSVSVVFFSIFTSIEMHFHTSFHFLMPFSHLFFLGANLELFVSSAVSLDILVILCQEFSLSHSPWEPLLWDWFLGRVLLWYPMVLVFPHKDLHAWHQIVDWLYFFFKWSFLF